MKTLTGPNENPHWIIAIFEFQTVITFFLFCMFFYFWLLSSTFGFFYWFFEYYTVSNICILLTFGMFCSFQNSAVLTLKNQLRTDALIKRCFAKQVFAQSPKIVRIPLKQQNLWKISLNNLIFNNNVVFHRAALLSQVK